MRGLLHRLAARAIGIASTVRPVDAATLFPPQEDPEAARAGDAVPSFGPQLTEPGNVAGSQNPPARDPDPIAGRLAAGRGRPEPVSLATPSSKEALAAKFAPIATGEPVPTAAPSRDAGEPSADEPSRPSPRTPQRAEDRATPATSELRAHRIECRVPSGPIGEEREAQSAPDPPRLFPSRPRDEGLPVLALAATRTRDAAGARAVEETTEVQVTIGRIDVTAVHEAPPSKREPARARKPRSLDEYLARRQERRS